MEKQIRIKNEKIKYILKSSQRAKNIRLTVYPNGELIAVKPLKAKQGLVEKFIQQKANWVLNKLAYSKQFKKNAFLKRNKQDYLKNKQKALDFVCQRIDFYNKIYQFNFNRISIRNQKTRWGSCSQKKNLNFNYQILFLPDKIADYVIIHELCHLKELNHSKKFWELVAQAMPDYLSARKELKKYGFLGEK